jgi:peptidoglycan hydrolase-like protein with peptidoglycan-binding domain
MPLQSQILANNPRLENANSGGPSVKKRLPDDEPSAVKAIQRALAALGHPLPQSFTSGDADGVFGDETFNAVQKFQQKAFPGQWSEWDGRCGPKTLQAMDERLPKQAAPQPKSAFVPLWPCRTASKCETTSPPLAANGLRPFSRPRSIA